MLREACWGAIAAWLVACGGEHATPPAAPDARVPAQARVEAAPEAPPAWVAAPGAPGPAPRPTSEPAPLTANSRPRFPPPGARMAAAPDASLASDDPDERERAVLEFEGDLTALGPLARGDASPAVRLAAVQRLAEGDGPGERSALRRALDDPDATIVAEAIRALELAGDAASIPALERLRGHPDAEIRALAGEALTTLRE